MSATIRKSRRSLRSAWVWGLSAAVSAALLSALLFTMDLGQVGVLLAQADPVLLLTAFAAISLSTAVSSWRLGVLARGDMECNVWDRFWITVRYGVYVVVLPARLGEILYMVRLNSDLGMRGGAALGVTFYQRLCDVAVLGALLVLGAAGAFVLGETPGALIATALALLAAITLGLLRFRSILDALLVRFHGRFGRVGRLRALVTRFALQARRWSRTLGRPGVVTAALALTAAEWGLNLAAIAAATTALGHPFTAAEIVFIGVCFNLLGALPLHTIGGFGVAEAGLTGLFMLFGLPFDTAAALGLLTRFVLFASPLILYGALLPVMLIRRSGISGTHVG